ncbi:MAG: hypothetical protein JJV95_06430, partial [Sulfurospirillum sp.]|nr:hypothetical protein [Sulfurospirillum sp.]
MVTKEDLANAILDLKISQKASDERYDKRQAKEDKRHAKRQIEKDKRDAEAEKRLDELGELIGDVSNDPEYIAEEFFYNSISANPKLNDIDYDFTDKNITRRRFGIEDEFDMVLINSKDVAIIETKY